MQSKEQRLQPTPSLACRQELELKQFCAEAQKIGVFSSSSHLGNQNWSRGKGSAPLLCWMHSQVVIAFNAADLPHTYLGTARPHEFNSPKIHNDHSKHLKLFILVNHWIFIRLIGQVLKCHCSSPKDFTNPFFPKGCKQSVPSDGGISLQMV